MYRPWSGCTPLKPVLLMLDRISCSPPSIALAACIAPPRLAPKPNATRDPTMHIRSTRWKRLSPASDPWYAVVQGDFGTAARQSGLRSKAHGLQRHRHLTPLCENADASRCCGGRYERCMAPSCLFLCPAYPCSPFSRCCLGPGLADPEDGDIGAFRGALYKRKDFLDTEEAGAYWHWPTIVSPTRSDPVFPSARLLLQPSRTPTAPTTTGRTATSTG